MPPPAVHPGGAWERGEYQRGSRVHASPPVQSDNKSKYTIEGGGGEGGKGRHRKGGLVHASE